MDADPGRGDHRRYEDMAVAHVLGGLDEQGGKVFRAHLLECADCRARVGELRSIAHDLAGVERTERRVRAAGAVDTKSRAPGEDEEAPPGRSSRSLWTPRLVAFGALALVIGLAAYMFTLRGQVASLSRQVRQVEAASAAMEHGEPVRLDYLAPEVTGTVKLHGSDLVVLLEGVTDKEPHALQLVQGEGDGLRVLRREPMQATGGRLFFLTTLRGDEDRLIVTAPAGSDILGDGSGSSTVVVAELPGPEPGE